MRDHNDIHLSGHLKDAPKSFGEDSASPGCHFTLCTRDEWRDTASGTTQERTDFIGIVAYGPTRLRALCLQPGDRILITGRLRNDQPTAEPKLRKTQVLARSIETLRTISLPHKDTP